MDISVSAHGRTIVFGLNGSQAAKDLWDQLPLELNVEDFGGNEKIFYPPGKLNTLKTPLADGIAGSLAYYEPWGNVVMFYEDFGKAAGLYELGNAVSGAAHIRELKGAILVEKAAHQAKRPPDVAG